MQQVKKQLQDAIKNLKSDWGINEVKREDLAAVLEKVVAALDRAAQLPVVPEPVGAVIHGIILSDSDVDYQPTGEAPDGAVPAYMRDSHLQGFFVGFYDEENRYLYTKDKNGNYADDVIGKNFLEYQGSLYFVERKNEDYTYKLLRIRYNEEV